MAEFVSGSLDSVVFWESKTFSKKRTAQPFPNSAFHISSLTWNSANTKLAVVPRQGDKVALCEFHDDIMTWSFLVNTEGGDFTAGCLLHNSRYLASGSMDYAVQIWDLKNRSIFRTFPGHTSPVTSIARSHNDRWIVSGGRDGSVIMHTIDSTTPWQLLQSPSEEQPSKAINRICFSHVEKAQLGSVSEDGVVCVWSVESQRLLNKYSSPHTGPATDLCFSPSNNMLMISVGLDSKIKCYDIQTRKIVTEVMAPSPLTSVNMLKDGSTLLAGSEDGSLYVYELRTVKHPKTTLVGHKTSITCIMQQTYSKSSRSSRSSRSSNSKGGKVMTPSSSIDSSTPVGGVVNSTSYVRSGGSTEQLQFGGTSLGFQKADPSSHKMNSVNITPFVTQPTSVTGSQADNISIDATPASNQGHVSSIFSPLDPNPTTGKVKVAGVDVTQPSTTPSISPTSPTSTHPPPSTAHLTSFTTTETSGIFSPVDNCVIAHSRSISSRQPVASPLLISHIKPKKIVVTKHKTPNQKIIVGSNALPSEMQGGIDHCDSIGDIHSADDLATAKSTSTASYTGHSHVSGVSGQLSQESQQSTNPPLGSSHSLHSLFSSLPDVSTCSANSSATDLLSDQVLAEQRGSIAAPPITPLPLGSSAPPPHGIQMKYIETLIRDAHEETMQAIHQDIRALSVDNIKFFCALQQQSATQHASLMEKVERLSEELRQVQEMVHQYMPRH